MMIMMMMTICKMLRLGSSGEIVSWITLRPNVTTVIHPNSFLSISATVADTKGLNCRGY